MAKRLFDIIVSLCAMVVVLPIVAIAAFLVWAEDGHSPIYRGIRVGRFGREFRMLKLRTMIPEGERLGGSSTAASDPRLTRFGGALRRLKIDELPQFWNVLAGDMSIVGPRPDVRRGGVGGYAAADRELLSVRPGITDLSSIVFSDEGEILKGSADPDALYEAVIRPWKHQLGLLCVERRSMSLDVLLIGLTVVALVSKRSALRAIDAILDSWDASAQLRRVCARSDPLPIAEPPGQVA